MDPTRRTMVATGGAALAVAAASPQAFGRYPDPAVEVLDMRDRHHPLHPQTRMALADVRARGRKAIVLLNRRGWSNFLSCRACGRAWMCPSCDVSLVLHMREGIVACHHCGHREPVPGRCNSCGSAALARHGAGTERLGGARAEAADDEPGLLSNFL